MGEKIKGYFRKLFKILRKPEMAILPGNIAFYLILAIIPLLTVIVLLANSFGISINFVADFIKGLMPSQVSGVVIDVISGKGFDNKVGLFSGNLGALGILENVRLVNADDNSLGNLDFHNACSKVDFLDSAVNATACYYLLAIGQCILKLLYFFLLLLLWPDHEKPHDGT